MPVPAGELKASKARTNRGTCRFMEVPSEMSDERLFILIFAVSRESRGRRHRLNVIDPAVVVGLAPAHEKSKGLSHGQIDVALDSPGREGPCHQLCARTVCYNCTEVELRLPVASERLRPFVSYR